MESEKRSFGESINVLQEAMQEIRSLRQQNEVLKAQVSVVDVFRKALNPVYVSMDEASRPDPLWRIEKHLSELVRLDKVTERLMGRVSQGGLQGAQAASQAQQAYQAQDAAAGKEVPLMEDGTPYPF